MSKSAIVIGAGIVGLATARALGRRGYKVTVLERTEKAVGASIRNFGMLWPIGQPEGKLLERALRSRAIWKEVCVEAGIWYNPSGSLHLAYTHLEAQVLEEFYEASKGGSRDCAFLSAEKALVRSSAIVGKDLKAGLFSRDEMVVNPRKAIAALPAYLTAKYGIEFIWNRTVTEIAYPSVWCGLEEYSADEIYVCTGADFETLYGALYAAQPLTKCKLQMMRMEQQNGWQMGPSLCGGLSLAHYKSFEAAPSLPQLKQYFRERYPDYVRWGIHVMVSQNDAGELTVGDSHEYGNTFDPFDKAFINELILDYLKGFARFPNERISETWNGIYPKMTNGATDLVISPEPGVTIINALSGAGMTLSFGLCEDVITNERQEGILTSSNVTAE